MEVGHVYWKLVSKTEIFIISRNDICLILKESRFVNDIQNQKQEIPDINDPAYLPVNLMNWEDDIILDNDLAREKLIRDYSSGSLPKCGWIPTPHTRTYQSFLNAWNNGTFIKMLTQPGQRPPTSQDSPEQMKAVVDSHNSLFPYDNYELEHTRWEDNIIWDATAMPAIPKPTVLTIDYEVSKSKVAYHCCVASYFSFIWIARKFNSKTKLKNYYHLITKYDFSII